jgi:hypothetical protein
MAAKITAKTANMTARMTVKMTDAKMTETCGGRRRPAASARYCLHDTL